MSIESHAKDDPQYHTNALIRLTKQNKPPILDLLYLKNILWEIMGNSYKIETCSLQNYLVTLEIDQLTQLSHLILAS